jgi:hypothetical protein
MSEIYLKGMAMHDEQQPADPMFQAWFRKRRQEILDEGKRLGVLNPKRDRSTRDQVKYLLADDLDTTARKGN